MTDILTPDLCVIGAGAGGLAVAEAARALGAEVVLVEPGRLGGSGLHTGAVPARALAAAAARAHAMRTAPTFGIAADEPRISFRRVHEHVAGAIAALAPDRGAPRYEAMGVQIVRAAGRFVDRRTLGAGETLIRARRFVIATGGKPVPPAIPGLDAVPFFTTDTILDNTRKLTHLVIFGAGGVGLELAQSHARLGTEVTVVDPGRPLASADPELAEVALRRLRDEGVVIRSETVVTAIHARSMGIGVAIRSGDDERVLDVSHILVATPRLPNLDGLDLDKAGIRLSKSAFGQLELRGPRTSNSRVFAIGDAAGQAASVHATALEAESLVRHVLLGSPLRTGGAHAAQVTHLDPEIAQIGVTEAEARARAGLTVTRIGYGENDLARVNRDTYGLAKLVTDRFGRIVGAGIVGPGAGETIALFALAMANGLSVRRLARLVAPYPSHADLARRLAAEAQRHTALGPLDRYRMALIRLLG